MAKDVKGSFTKPETTKKQKEIDQYQSHEQSVLAERLKKYEQVQTKNNELFEDAAFGEEGVDYVRTTNGGPVDPRKPNMKVLERELKA